MINFMQNLQTEEHDFQEAFENAAHTDAMRKGNIPTSKDISGIEIRLSNVTIIDNKTPKVFPFPGLANVYFINLVISDLDQNSFSLDLKGFEKVADNQKLNIDRVLYFWKKTDQSTLAPSQIHIFSSLIKSKQPLRDVGKIMSEVNNDKNFKDVLSTLSTLIKTASNLTSIGGLIFQVAGIVGNFLGKVDDKPYLTMVQSFTDIHGDYDILGETTKNAINRYASIDLSITIRDAARQKEVDLNLVTSDN